MESLRGTPLSVQDSFDLDESLEVLSDEFGVGRKVSRFQNAGVMQDYHVSTMKVYPASDEEGAKLEDVLQHPDEVDESFFITDLSKWSRLKDAKKEPRVHKGSNTPYMYAEGAIAFPDRLDMPSRTILTGEGGSSPSRFKHVIRASDGRLRRLTPFELERLNGFPGQWTEGFSDNKRAFLMGNALVVGVVARIAKVLEAEFQYKNVLSRTTI
jgi:DNA (cytosine-5)-methyltransferase 1